MLWKLTCGFFLLSAVEAASRNVHRVDSEVSLALASTQDFVQEHNELFAKGRSPFGVTHNKFSDLSLAEFSERYASGVINLPNEIVNGTEWAEVGVDSVPDSIDWTQKGIATSVRDQGECNACYAIASAQALEAAIFLRTGSLVELSEQHILDCSHLNGNTGCAGGRMSAAFQWIKKNGGVGARKSYPYEGEVKTCRNAEPVARVKGFASMPKKGGEEQLKKIVATVGPVSVSIDAQYKSLAQYNSGIWEEPKCTEQVTHAVLLVGYGSENGKDFWLIKNSWGTDWGSSGYFKMSRKFSCGIYTMVTYPYV